MRGSSPAYPPFPGMVMTEKYMARRKLTFGAGGVSGRDDAWDDDNDDEDEPVAAS